MEGYIHAAQKHLNPGYSLLGVTDFTAGGYDTVIEIKTTILDKCPDLVGFDRDLRGRLPGTTAGHILYPTLVYLVLGSDGYKLNHKVLADTTPNHFERVWNYLARAYTSLTSPSLCVWLGQLTRNRETKGYRLVTGVSTVVARTDYVTGYQSVISSIPDSIPRAHASDKIIDYNGTYATIEDVAHDAYRELVVLRFFNGLEMPKPTLHNGPEKPIP